MAFSSLAYPLFCFSRTPSCLLSVHRSSLPPSTAAAAPPETNAHLVCADDQRRNEEPFFLSAATKHLPDSQDAFLEDFFTAAVSISDKKEQFWPPSELQITLSAVLERSGIKPISVRGDLNTPIAGIQNDSRNVSSGDLFVCCVGRRADGHRYAADAVKNGAFAVVACKDVNLTEFSGCRAVVMVEDTNAVLGVLASSFYGHPSRTMSVVGITGTNGKTTSALLIKGVYDAMGYKTGMLGTVGYFINGEHDQWEVPNTTPDAVTAQRLMAKMVSNGTEVVVMEASSHGLALGRCDEIDFNVAVFTNLTRDHYDFHTTEDVYMNSKAKLFDKMLDPRRHRKVVNIDDPKAWFFAARGNSDVPVVTFAMENENADVYPLRFELSLLGSWVLVCTPKGVVEISSPLLGRHNVYNILATVALGFAIGARMEEIVRGIEGVKGVPGRCELIDENQPFAVMVDFAHTPDALSKVLDMVRELGARRIITVFGCPGESDRGKRPIMTTIAADKSDVVILTTDNPKTENPLDILNDMLAGVGWTMRSYVQHGKNDSYATLPNGHKLFVHGLRRVAIRTAIAMAEKGDIVVVAGRGHETYQLEGDRKRYIDDREECREALRFIDELHRAAMDKRVPVLVTEDSLINFCKDVEAWFTLKDQSDTHMLPVF